MDDVHLYPRVPVCVCGLGDPKKKGNAGSQLNVLSGDEQRLRAGCTLSHDWDVRLIPRLKLVVCGDK